MVKIVKGVYGFVDENGVVQPKTSKDAPFSMAKELEARLVEKGVAVYVKSNEDKQPEKKEEVKKPASKKSGKVNTQKKKESEVDEEPPTIEAVDPE